MGVIFKVYKNHLNYVIHILKYETREDEFFIQKMKCEKVIVILNYNDFELFLINKKGPATHVSGCIAVQQRKVTNGYV